MAQSFNSGDFNPIDFASASHYFVLAGVKSPGAIPVDGIHGFDRKTGWDKKKGKGTQGATLTLTSFPPAEGSIDLQLWTAAQFDAWDFFRALLKYDPTKKASGAAAAVDIFHPELAKLGINRVVTESLTPIRHTGRGLYVVTISFIEWINPPPVSVVQTTTTSKSGSSNNTPGAAPDPVGNAQQAEIKRLLAAAANTPVG